MSVRGTRMFTVTEFAELVGRDRSTIWRWVKNSYIPSFQIGTVTYISLGAVRTSLPALYELLIEELVEG